MKDTYIAPSIEIIKIEIEGSIMVLSAGTSGPTHPGVRGSSYRSRSAGSRNSAGLSELEDMISDILQFEQ